MYRLHCVYFVVVCVLFIVPLSASRCHCSCRRRYCHRCRCHCHSVVHLPQFPQIVPIIITRILMRLSAQHIYHGVLSLYQHPDESKCFHTFRKSYTLYNEWNPIHILMLLHLIHDDFVENNWKCAFRCLIVIKCRNLEKKWKEKRVVKA